jgi:hypothetical protein
MAHDIKSFMERVMAVTPQYGDIFANGIPGSGSPNVGAEKTQDLYRAARAFARAYADPSTEQETVRRLAIEAEGALMVVVTLGVVPEHTVDQIIDELHQLVAEKSSPATT